MAQNSLHFALEPVDNNRLANLCGTHDNNLKAIENLLAVRIQHRGEHFRVLGDNPNAQQAQEMLRDLYQQADGELNPELLQFTNGEHNNEDSEFVRGQEIAGVKIRNQSQANYIRAIQSHDVTFGVGASGTGKTFIAMACALHALQTGEVRRIVLVRPAVEAGESLGYLPGDPVQKVDPYLRPLQDALGEISRNQQLTSQQRDSIELAPLAFMRGRTLTNSFVILDEAQNTTKAQMLMFLTRLGKGSRCVVTGDESQIDLPQVKNSGLADILARIKNIDGCTAVRFGAADTMRHPVVERILQAYHGKK